MSTKRSLIYWEHPERDRADIHIFSEMHDDHLYLEVEVNHFPGTDSYAKDWHRIRLCPDTREARASILAAFGVATT